MLSAYRQHAAERAALGIPALPLSAQQVAELIELIKAPPAGEEAFLLELLSQRVPPGVDDAAKVKASFLAAVAHGDLAVGLISRSRATEWLGTMVGGYNVHPLIELLDDAEVGPVAAEGLKKTLLMFDYFNDVEVKARAGNALAAAVMRSWAEAEWFTSRPEVPRSITVTVFKVEGETNTDDLSPAPDAWSRPDIPLHALALLKNARPGITPEEDGKRGPIAFIESLKARGHTVAYVGDVVGTGSSRKSATNSVVWHTGQDIPFVPNKRFGGITLGGKIAPIFFNTQEDSGSLPIEVDVSLLHMGETVDILPYDGKVLKDGQAVAEFQIKSDVLFDEVRAGGRINLIIGRSLTAKAREFLGLPASTVFRLPQVPTATKAGFTLAQKMVGRACGLPEGQGVRPGTYCEPKMTSVGSQDTTGPMTRDELKDLACLGFSADLVMQSFCHTSAYPKPVDVKTHRELPAFMSNRGGISLKPGDGVIHSWLNRMLLQDTVGTGGDSHTPLPDRHQLPRRLRPRGFRRGHRRDAAGHARVGARALQGEDAARHHAARPGARHPLLRPEGGDADGGQGGQEERLLRAHPRDRGPAGSEGRAGLRVVRCQRRAQRRRLHHQAGQGADHRVPQQQHRAAEEHDRRWLPGQAQHRASHPPDAGVAGQSAVAGRRCRRRIRGRDRDRHERDHRAAAVLPE